MKLDINRLSYRETQISGLLTALIHEVEPLINRLSVDDAITSELAIATAVDLSYKSDAIISLLYAIQDINYTNKKQLDILDKYELDIKHAIENKDGEK